MSTTLSDIKNALSHFKLDDSLLYLNHILSVSRGWSSDSELEPKLQNEERPAVLPHVVHFIAKQLLLNASNLGTKTVYKSKSDGFEPFSFNPLTLRPIVNLGKSRYLAVDPEILVERVTFGLFHDLFAKHKMAFTEPFGFVFEAFVGQLLRSQVSGDLLWSASEWEDSTSTKKKLKLCDWVYQGSSATVLFECKSLRPSLKLTTYADDNSLNDLNMQIAKAVTQLSRHAKGIEDSAWSESGLSPAADYVGVVVTYRKLYTANDPFCRDHVAAILADTDVEPIPYIVLSIEDLDSLVRLVELGHPLDKLASQMVFEAPSGPLALFRSELEEVSLSSFSMNKGREFLDGIVE